jgi:hypothetical protein
MPMKLASKNPKDLFESILEAVSKRSIEMGEPEHKAFIKWFSDIFFYGKQNVFITDDTGDGRIDAIVEMSTYYGKRYAAINSKFTKNYRTTAPVSFYNEIVAFRSNFINKANRDSFLENSIRSALRGTYKKLFKNFDDGLVDLYFITNHKRNPNQAPSVKFDDIDVFHLDNLLLFMSDYLLDGMPKTPELLLNNINSILTPSESESSIATTIVFAKIIDFIKYHEEQDPHDLLFSRNIRYDLGKTEANREITYTFNKHPSEFVYSNNGITLICDETFYKPGLKEIRITNPRVVNGSQTLHSVRNASKWSDVARVMLRLLSIPKSHSESFSDYVDKKKKLIDVISTRTNLQNPIKKFDLVANDDFQYETARYFRQYRIFYERRRNEWKTRRHELKAIGGYFNYVSMPYVMQLLACTYYSKFNLGPAVAKRQASLLFDKDRYDTLCKTRIEKVFSLYCVDQTLKELIKPIAKRTAYVRNIRRPGHLLIFTCIYILFKESNEAFELIQDFENSDNKYLIGVTKKIFSKVNEDYKKVAVKYLREKDTQLSYTNYFKNTKYVNSFLDKFHTNELKNMVRKAIH